MAGILSQKSNLHLMSLEEGNAESGGGGGGSFVNTMATQAPATAPTQQFDLSVLQGLKSSDKYLGKNRVSDIQEAYQTYITGNPIGRGGQYAVDSARKYGVSIVEAARGYLQGVGLPIIPSVATNPVTDTNTNTNTNTDTKTNTDTVKNPFDILADAFSKAFGNAVYNPPLQSQSYGYTPTELSQPLAQTSGGSSGIGLYVILAIVAIVGYFLYKKFAS